MGRVKKKLKWVTSEGRTEGGRVKDLKEVKKLDKMRNTKEQ